LRTSNNATGSKQYLATKDFVLEAQNQDGKPLTVMEIPMDLASIPDPVGFQYDLHISKICGSHSNFRDLNTSEAALNQTTSLPGCKYVGTSSTKQVTASTTGASTLLRLNSAATLLRVICGTTMWYCTAGSMSNISALRNSDIRTFCAKGGTIEGLLLEAGDVL
jgi:hypothetical protein